MKKHLREVIRKNKQMKRDEPIKFYMRVLNTSWIFIGAIIVLIYALTASDHTMRDTGIAVIAAAAGFKAFIQYFLH